MQINSAAMAPRRIAETFKLLAGLTRHAVRLEDSWISPSKGKIRVNFQTFLSMRQAQNRVKCCWDSRRRTRLYSDSDVDTWSIRRKGDRSLNPSDRKSFG